MPSIASDSYLNTQQLQCYAVQVLTHELGATPLTHKPAQKTFYLISSRISNDPCIILWVEFNQYSATWTIPTHQTQAVSFSNHDHTVYIASV